MIREGTFDDGPEIVALLETIKDETEYEGIPVDRSKLFRTIAMSLQNQSVLVLVMEEDSDIVGVLVGVTDELFFSRKKYATDLIFFIKEGNRGQGALMVKRFIDWAKTQPRVVDISMALGMGGGDIDRTGELYERIGLMKVGSFHNIRVES